MPASVPIPNMNEVADFFGWDVHDGALDKICAALLTATLSSPPCSASCGNGDVIARFHVCAGFYHQKIKAGTLRPGRHRRGRNVSLSGVLKWNCSVSKVSQFVLPQRHVLAYRTLDFLRGLRMR